MGGNLYTRAPVQEWLKPKRVTLRATGVTMLDVLGLVTVPAELEFVLHTPSSAPPPRARRVRPTTDIFEKFLGLAAARDEEIYRFASKFGALLVFCQTEETASNDEIVIIERTDVWRYFASCMKSLLQIAGSFHLGRSPNPADWDAIGNYPMRVGLAKEERVDRLHPSLLRGEDAWKTMAFYVAKGSDRDRAIWTELLNSLLELGRVRPWVLWEGSGSDARPKLVFSGPNLLSYLALQLCLTASKHDSFVVCSYCNRQYSPTKRAPKTGQRNFCPECRADGVPIRIAQRARRERLREKK